METNKYKNKSTYLDNNEALVEVEQVEERHHHHRHHRQSFSSTSTTQSTSISSARGDGLSLRKAAVSSSSSSSRLAQSEAALQVSRRNAVNHAAATTAIASTSTSKSSTSSTTDSRRQSQHFQSSSNVSGGASSESSAVLTSRSLVPVTDEVDPFLNPDSLFSSPHVRSLAKETWRDFAELENQALSTTDSGSSSGFQQSSSYNKSNFSSLSTRLFGRRLLAPVKDSSGGQYSAIVAQDESNGQDSRRQSLFSQDEREWNANSNNKSTGSPTSRFSDWNTSYADANAYLATSESAYSPSAERREAGLSNGNKIKELINKAQSLERFNNNKNSSLGSAADEPLRITPIVETDDTDDEATEDKKAKQIQEATTNGKDDEVGESSKELEQQKKHSNAAVHCKRMIVPIERIDQRMSDFCKKLNECHDTKEAIDLLKIMIQMIEKAWSVPVCGDDLGFKLCSSLRDAGGLDIILGFIHDHSEDQQMMLAAPNKGEKEQLEQFDKSPRVSDAETVTEMVIDSNTKSIKSSEGDENLLAASKVPVRRSSAQQKNDSSSNPLRLDLAKVTQSVSYKSEKESAKMVPVNVEENTKDSESEASYASATQTPSSVTGVNREFVVEIVRESDEKKAENGLEEVNQKATEKKVEDKNLEEQEKPEEPVKEAEVDKDEKQQQLAEHCVASERLESTANSLDEEEACLRKEELVFLSARLLSQCLTSENRNYIVDNGLDSVIKLACNFTTMKSIQSHRLLSRSLIMRQSSTVSSSSVKAVNDKTTNKTSANQAVKQEHFKKQHQQSASLRPDSEATKQAQKSDPSQISQQQQPTAGDHSDTHAIIGTEILQHLFKHSEDTCSRIISLGGLQAILYGCRSSNIETLRHCASALANLALYGGPDSQEIMIHQKAHVWLFPLAFNEDDNIQYYACLAIVVLVANQEIEADVLKSSTLDLVEPFVTSHEPKKFAESTTSHIHGQSPAWLRKLIPLLNSKREEARNLACFHFAMEAYIKKEQGQREIFRKIGAVEPLRKVGSSPKGIASKFACQALRLIGEKEPHKLSQQVPLWTTEDVVEWVNQVGFERYRQAFVDSQVDGDLLLQLDEEMLRFDIGIENGILRRRFLRELANLKQIADYSSVDKSGLSHILASVGAQSQQHQNNEFIQYIYPLAQLGVTKDNIHLFDSEQLMRECKISNSISRIKLAHSIKELQEKSALTAATNEINSPDGVEQKTLDVFVSYRRATGSQLASLLKVHLQLRGLSVFIDVERLEAGKFDNNLLDSIKTAKNFILVLSPNALDRCIGDVECKDWVHKEIVAALASDCNIIPIMDNFLWPDAEQLPEDMRSITYFNGVRWIHDYQDACVDKVERFIRGEIYDGTSSVCGQSVSSAQSNSLQRQAANNQPPSTPSILATPSITTSSVGFQLNQTTRNPQATPPFNSSSSNASDVSLCNNHHHHPLAAATHQSYLQHPLRPTSFSPTNR